MKGNGKENENYYDHYEESRLFTLHTYIYIYVYVSIDAHFGSLNVRTWVPGLRFRGSTFRVQLSGLLWSRVSVLGLNACRSLCLERWGGGRVGAQGLGFRVWAQNL